MFAQEEVENNQKLQSKINEELAKKDEKTEPKKAMLRRTNTIDVKKHEAPSVTPMEISNLKNVFPLLPNTSLFF